MEKIGKISTRLELAETPTPSTPQAGDSPAENSDLANGRLRLNVGVANALAQSMKILAAGGHF